MMLDSFPWEKWYRECGSTCAWVTDGDGWSQQNAWHGIGNVDRHVHGRQMDIWIPIPCTRTHLSATADCSCFHATCATSIVWTLELWMDKQVKINHSGNAMLIRLIHALWTLEFGHSTRCFNPTFLYRVVVMVIWQAWCSREMIHVLSADYLGCLDMWLTKWY